MAENFNIELYYRFTRQDSRRSFMVKRDVAAPVLVGVGGRWTVVDRPRRTSFTTWDGNDPYRMDVPILFDGWDDFDSIEAEVALLNEMRLSDDFVQPPQVRVEGALPVKNATWVIEAVDFGDNVIWHENNYRLRQDAVVHLLQFIEADSLVIKAPSTSHIHAVRSGETLKSISKDEYGTSKYWSAIQKANKIRDPKKLPKTLRIPPLVSPSG